MDALLERAINADLNCVRIGSCWGFEVGVSQVEMAWDEEAAHWMADGICSDYLAFRCVAGEWMVEGHNGTDWVPAVDFPLSADDVEPVVEHLARRAGAAW